MSNAYMVYGADVPPRTSTEGRYRQFHQAGVEVFGIANPEIDAELIILTARPMERVRHRSACFFAT